MTEMYKSFYCLILVLMSIPKFGYYCLNNRISRKKTKEVLKGKNERNVQKFITILKKYETKK